MQDVEDELLFDDVELSDALEVAESMIRLLTSIPVNTAGKAVILHLAREVVRLRKV